MWESTNFKNSGKTEKLNTYDYCQNLRKKNKQANKTPEYPSKISNNVSSRSARSSFIRLDTHQILKG